MSYWEKCGQYVDDNTRFCQNCGAENSRYNGAPAAYQQPVETAQPVAQSGLNAMAIVAMALSETGIVGLIFSIIALKNAKSGNYRTPLKPLAVAALIVSIIMIVCWIIIIIASIAGANAIHYYY